MRHFGKQSGRIAELLSVEITLTVAAQVLGGAKGTWCWCTQLEHTVGRRTKVVVVETGVDIEGFALVKENVGVFGDDFGAVVDSLHSRVVVQVPRTICWMSTVS